MWITLYSFVEASYMQYHFVDPFIWVIASNQPYHYTDTIADSV